VLGKKPSKRSIEELKAFLTERRAVGNECGRDESGRFGSGNRCQDDGDEGGGGSGKEGRDPPSKGKAAKSEGASASRKPPYMELKKGDHAKPGKMKKAQDFIDKAREEQLSKGGKDGGQSDEGGGVQTWSKGDDFPWTTKQVGTDEGYVQGLHPDGSKTEKYPFKGDAGEAYKAASGEIAKKKNKRSREVISETLAFLKERSR
jgi:hypothetical protein